MSKQEVYGTVQISLASQFARDKTRDTMFELERMFHDLGNAVMEENITDIDLDTMKLEMFEVSPDEIPEGWGPIKGWRFSFMAEVPEVLEAPGVGSE